MILLKSEDQEGDANDTKRSTNTSIQFIVTNLKVILSLILLVLLWKGLRSQKRLFSNFHFFSIYYQKVVIPLMLVHQTAEA